jgi:hypothetical protein
VAVVTPGEYWRQPGFNADIAGFAIASRFNAGIEQYVRRHPSPHNVGGWVSSAARIYEAILNG